MQSKHQLVGVGLLHNIILCRLARMFPTDDVMKYSSTSV
jgi:hypothetical protein